MAVKRVSRLLVTVTVLMMAAPFRICAGDDIELAGNILVVALPAAAAGMALGHKDWEGAFEFGESAALTMAVTFGLKTTITTARPNGGGQSFPSGHASMSFCTAAFFQRRYGLEYGLPSYAVASYVAYSRVEARKHTTVDVMGGAVIGILSSYIFTKPYKGWSVEPRVDANYYGVQLVKSW